MRRQNLLLAALARLTAALRKLLRNTQRQWPAGMPAFSIVKFSWERVDGAKHSSAYRRLLSSIRTTKISIKCLALNLIVPPLLWRVPVAESSGLFQASSNPTKQLRQFEQIVRNAPYSDYAALALMNIAIVSEQQHRPEDAIDALDRLINYYPSKHACPRRLL